LELELEELFELELDELLELEFEELLEFEFEELFELEFDELLELELEELLELEFDELLPANCSSFSSPAAPIPGSSGPPAFGARTMLLMPPVSPACGMTAACETLVAPVIANAKAIIERIPLPCFMIFSFIVPLDPASTGGFALASGEEIVAINYG
jgi:hypothetical protein